MREERNFFLLRVRGLFNGVRERPCCGNWRLWGFAAIVWVLSLLFAKCGFDYFLLIFLGILYRNRYKFCVNYRLFLKVRI